MSRSNKPRGKFCQRVVKNAFLKKALHIYGDDFYARNNQKQLSRIVRARLQEQTRKEIADYD